MAPQAKGRPNDYLDGVMVPAPDAAAKDDPPWVEVLLGEPLDDPLVPCRFGTTQQESPPRHVAVIGDSHARVLMATVDPSGGDRARSPPTCTRRR